MKIFHGHGKKYPVIMIFDTDDGAKEVLKKLGQKSIISPFIRHIDNLYVIFISDKADIEIEELFDKKLLEVKIDGKPFNPKKIHGIETEYGKRIFAERVIKPNQKNINFDGFKPLLNNIRLVLEDYREKTSAKHLENTE